MEAPCLQEEPAEPHPAERLAGGGELDDAGLDVAGLDDAGLDDAGLDDAGLDDAGLDVAGRLQDLHLEEAAAFSPFFISVVEEADLYEEDDALRRARQLLREYESREGAAAEEEEPGGGGGSRERYEKAEARHGDRVFGGFMKRISRCPQQILRYRRGGRPLFVSAPPGDASRLAAPCGACGAARTFELQLMPALVSLLQWAEPRGAARLEFGTVLVYTCSRSCWTPRCTAAMEEVCFVQTDPDQQLFTS